MAQWRFYVYELRSECGTVQYIGKGSGNRLAVSARTKGLCGDEVARFRSEKAAYAFEVERIAELSPPMNICKGGNGPRTRRVMTPRKSQWDLVYEKLGSRVYAARLLDAYSKMGWIFPKIEEIRRVAYGTAT